ncbi:MAG: DNA-binding response regulator [Deltaproteobacteria bacterium]|nr:MAG: DNA-binding response regulator [Deltaproteobacteria bacterium]
MSRVLLVEDEQLVGTMIRMNLESAGHQVDWLRDGQQALDRLQAETFDLVLLDIGLPRVDGLEVLQSMRRQGLLAPVLMLTARDDVATKVQALEQGADDYLPKPFDVAELIARVGALIRRAQGERALPAEEVIHLGEYWVNLATREALTRQGRLVLGEKETALAALLVRSAGRVLSRSDILDEVWGMDATPTERTVDNFIVKLRRLFEAEPEAPRHILTVRGRGYRFET